MSKLEELVPPMELCKLIPKGEFEDSAFIWDKTTSVGFWDGEDKDGNHIGGFGKIPHKEYRLRQNYSERCRKHLKEQGIELDIFPAPTLQEIMEKLHGGFNLTECNRGVRGWLIDCCVGIEDIYARDEHSGATAALKLWLEQKGIEYEK